MATNHRHDPGWGPAWPTDEQIYLDTLVHQPVIAAMLARVPRSATTEIGEVCSRLLDLHAELVVSCLDEYSIRILHLGVLEGALRRERLLAEADGVDEAALDACVQRLTVLGLVEINDGDLRVRPAAMAPLQFPLPMFMGSLQGLTSERLGLACRLLGIDAGTTKAARAEAIRRMLRDPEQFLAAIADAGPEAGQVFSRILEASLEASEAGVGVGDYGVGTVGQWELGLPSALLHRGYGSGLHDVRRGPPRSPFEELTARCLVGSDGMGRVTWAWFDTLVALNGTTFNAWTPMDAGIREIDEPVGVAARVLAAADVVLEQVGADAHEGKKTGDRQPPVKAIKSSAAIAGVDPGLAVVLVGAAIHLGLLMAVERPRRGRGRNTEHPVAWVLNEDRMREWRSQPPEQRWLGVVAAWLEGNDTYTASGMRAWARRLCTVASLAALEPGQGAATGLFAVWVRARHAVCDEKMEDVMADLSRLGVCSSGAVIGLGSAGRAALAGGAGDDGASPELAECFTGGETTFVVQPDHTIVSAANLAPDVISMLTLIADQESDGAAVVWRLSAPRLGRAARSHRAEEIIEFLRAGSTVPVSDNVERFVRDHVVSVDALTITPAGSYIIVADPARLTAALAIKTAKLVLLAPTVAVSPLDPTKVRDVLAAKGVHVETADPAGGAASGSGGRPRPVHPPEWLLAQRPPDQPLDRAEALPVGTGLAADLAHRLDGR